IAHVLARAYAACGALEDELALRGKLAFDAAQLRVTLLDRLATPHTDATLSAAQGAVRTVVSPVLAARVEVLEVRPVGDRAAPVTLDVAAPFVDITNALKRIGSGV